MLFGGYRRLLCDTFKFMVLPRLLVWRGSKNDGLQEEKREPYHRPFAFLVPLLILRGLEPTVVFGPGPRTSRIGALDYQQVGFS